ncbi:MAG: fused MFS/spermidine synthase [Acidobacteria bacterium]|nr:fused MFS/spermidine synthase [Acidobacteriota bacterium]
MGGRSSFLFIYLLSGAAALLYEVAWSRVLTLHMGHTVGAIGTVLAALMSGLALGAALAGRKASTMTPARALQVYAVLEVGIAVCAILLPFAVHFFDPLLGWAYRDGQGGLTFAAARVMSSFIVLAIPAAAMGATFPIAVRWVATSGVAAARAGALYAANTIGAAVGAAAAGFVLLPSIGLTGTTAVGVALNLLAATGAVALGRRTIPSDLATMPRRPERARADARRRKDPRADSKRRNHAPPPVLAGRPWLAATALGISGFLALAHEVIWTRLLAMILGPTTYAFSAMLIAFITGLAIGSAGAAALVRRTQRPGWWLGLVIMMSAATALVASGTVDRLPLAVAEAVARPDTTFRAVLWHQTTLAVAILIPMTIAFGAAFPLGVALAASDRSDTPRRVATVYAINTVGAIAGALTASFVLVPLVGLERSIRLLAVLAIGGGVAVAWLGDPHRFARTVGVLVAGAVATLMVLASPWNRELISSGAYKYAPYLVATDVQAGLEAGDLLSYEEGAAGTVSVKRLAGATSLSIDGKVDASNAGDMLTQKLLAHLPLLLHRNPKDVCVIGLGSGVTVGAALTHPVTRVDVLEISPEVVRASDFFARENHDALRDRRARLVIGDGRSHLMLGRAAYDVIVSEPSNPWMAGVAALFTREFFHAARERLTPGGILCQWAHTYDISAEDLRSIVSTFMSEFPGASAWLIGEGDLLLIGPTAPLQSLDTGIQDAWSRPGVANDLATVGARSPLAVLSLFLAQGADLRRYLEGASLQSDSRMSLEFSAPRAIFGRSADTNVTALRALARRASRPRALDMATQAASAGDLRDRGLMQLQAEAYAVAYDDLRDALGRNPSDAQTLEGLGRAAAGARRAPEAATFLRALADRHRDNIPVLLELSRLLASLGNGDEAIETVKRALTIRPTSVAALEQLASIASDEGNLDALEPVVEDLERLAQQRPSTMFYRATLHYLRGEFDRAAAVGEQVVALEPANARAWNLLGGAYASLGHADRARRAFDAAIRSNPRDPAALVNYGTFELGAANPWAAAERFAEALAIDPFSTAALGGLADALERQGQPARAERLRRLIPAV